MPDSLPSKTSPLHAHEATFARNLAAIRLRSPTTAKKLASVQADPSVVVSAAPDGFPTADIEHGGTRRRLASAHRPGEEGQALVRDIDLASAGVVVVFGFGVGHHVRALSERMRRAGLVVVFEPNLAMLRAVLERVDCAGWIEATNVVVLSDESEPGEISEATRGFEAAIACGLRLIDHPPSRVLLGSRAAVFSDCFTNVVKAVRTAVVTTLVHVDVSLRNSLQNLDHYLRWPGLNELAGVAAGRAAIVVSAGPSLVRNLHLLEDPKVRERFVIIATQTMLKPLLARGIKPHFVTALDYHEISKRFYEGLTPGDVEGITLVVEPKANPAILEAFPGAIRSVADGILDDIVGASRFEKRSELPPGATVAHLAYYLARHLGADPVIMIGQDLGFSDHCYYGPGAAIHRVWGPELGEFRTIEMLEWERITRMKSLLRRVEDQSGGPMFTDEQMATYLVQFERDFHADTSRGLTVIDATEGGSKKRHATQMTLAEAIRTFRGDGRMELPSTRMNADAESRIQQSRQRLATLLTGAAEMERLSRNTCTLLEDVRDHQEDQDRVNRIIPKVHANATKVTQLGEAHWLVQYISQTSQLRRFRADRALQLASESLSPLERQRGEIERDLSNVRWLADGAARVQTLLRGATAALAGGEKETRDSTDGEPGEGVSSHAKVGAMVVFDSERTGLNTPRPSAEGARETLRVVLAQLATVEGLNGVVVLVPPDSAIGLLGDRPAGLQYVTLTANEWQTWRTHRTRVGAARVFQAMSWRGAVGNTTIFDEAVCPAVVGEHAKRLGWDAVLAIGCDWTGLEATLNTKLIDRYRENETPAVVFSQAPPGVAGAVIPTSLLNDLAGARSRLATLGGVLGYLPAAPQADPIAKSACVLVAPELRDAYERRIEGEHACESDGLPRWIDIIPESKALAPHRWIECLTGLVQERPDAAVTVDLRTCAESVVPTAAAEWSIRLRAAGVAAIHLRIKGDAAGDWVNAVDAEVVSIDGGAAPADDDQERMLRIVQACADSTKWIVPRLTKSGERLQLMEGWYDFWLQAAGCAVIDPPMECDRLAPFPWPPAARVARDAQTWTIDGSGMIRAGGGVVGDLQRESMMAVLDQVRAVQAERLVGAGSEAGAE